MFIDVLRNQTVALKAGMRMLTGLVGDLPIPKKTASATWAHYDEEGSVADDATLAFGQVALSPKRIAGRVLFSRQLLLQSTPNIESIIRQDLADGASNALDYFVFLGSGANDQPQGLLSLTNRNTMSFGGAATYAKVLSMIGANMADNADSMNSVFVIDAATWEKWSSKERGASAAGNFILPDAEMIRGRKVYVTEQLSAAHRAVYGDFTQAMAGQWGGLELLADPYTKAQTGQIILNAAMYWDFAVRHPVAFCVSTDTAAA